MIAVALGIGVVNAFSTPAQQALITQLVEREDIPAAIALNSMTYNLARAVGPVLGAVSVSQLGIPATFLINAFSYLAFVGLLLITRPRVHERATRAEARLRESVRLLRDNPRLVMLLLVVAAVSFCLDPVNTLSPAFAHAFGRRDTVAGFIIGAFGAGAVTAAFVLAGRGSNATRRLAASLGLFSVAIVLFCASPWLPLGFVFLGFAGFGYLATNTYAASQLQLQVEERQRGRIMALWSIAFFGLRPLSSLIDGAIASAAGVRWAGIVLALPALSAAALLWRRSLRADAGRS